QGYSGSPGPVLRVFGSGRAGVWRGLAVLGGRSAPDSEDEEPPIRAVILTRRCSSSATARGDVLVVPESGFAGYCAVSGSAENRSVLRTGLTSDTSGRVAAQRRADTAR